MYNTRSNRPEFLIDNYFFIFFNARQGRKPLNTPNKLQYTFHAVRSGSVLIDVKAKSNGHIALTDRKGESSPMYEIMLGGWENKASAVRYNRKQPDKVRNDFRVKLINRSVNGTRWRRVFNVRVFSHVGNFAAR